MSRRKEENRILEIANSCMFFDQHWQSESAKLTFEMRKERKKKRRKKN